MAPVLIKRIKSNVILILLQLHRTNGRHCHCSSTDAGNDGTEDQMQRKLIGCNLTVMVLENNEEIEDDYVIVNAH